LEDDDDFNEEVVSQSPLTPELKLHAAVHGFTEGQLFEVELVLRDSSVRRRVEQSVSPASSDSKVKFVRNILKALTDVRRTSIKSWSGRLP
jgi:hypothetical protein